MKRNIFIVLTLALVCVLFVACGKEEITQQQFNAAMSKVEEAEAALSAAKAELQNLNQNGNNSAVFVNPAAAGQPTPVEKTREEMTEEEREAYDRAKFEEFVEQLENDPSIDIHDTISDGLVHNMGFYCDTDGREIPIYIPGLDTVPKEPTMDFWVSAVNLGEMCDIYDSIAIYSSVSDEYLYDFSIKHPEDFMASHSLVPIGSILLGVIALVYAIFAIFEWRDIHNSKE